MTIPDYKIRHARSGDLRTIVKLSKTSWPAWWSENYKLGLEHIKRRIKDKSILVAAIDGKIIGYAIFGVIWNYMHLEDCFVSKRYRKLGMGSALLKNQIQIAKRLRLKQVISDLDISNDVSLKWHLKNGFKRSGYIARLWGNQDSYVMSKSL